MWSKGGNVGQENAGICNPAWCRWSSLWVPRSLVSSRPFLPVLDCFKSRGSDPKYYPHALPHIGLWQLGILRKQTLTTVPNALEMSLLMPPTPPASLFLFFSSEAFDQGHALFCTSLLHKCTAFPPFIHLFSFCLLLLLLKTAATLVGPRCHYSGTCMNHHACFYTWDLRDKTRVCKASTFLTGPSPWPEFIRFPPSDIPDLSS